VEVAVALGMDKLLDKSDEAAIYIDVASAAAVNTEIAAAPAFWLLSVGRMGRGLALNVVSHDFCNNSQRLGQFLVRQKQAANSLEERMWAAPPRTMARRLKSSVSPYCLVFSVVVVDAYSHRHASSHKNRAHDHFVRQKQEEGNLDKGTFWLPLHLHDVSVGSDPFCHSQKGPRG